MDKHVAEMLQGYARAEAFTERERRERLQRLTPEEAREIFSQLMADWSGPRKGDDLEMLQAWRLETLVAVRQAFIKLARSKGLL